MAALKLINTTHKGKDQNEAVVMKKTGVVDNEEIINCKNCDWVGKRNALLKHLRMKSICTSMYDMQSVYAEQDQLKKIRKQHYDKMQYAKTLEKKRQYYQEKKEERKAYYDENRDQRL